jgi:uncharacterized protein (DUF2249 family)
MSTDTVDDKIHELDAREIDGEPFDQIMSALDSLPEEGTLILINSFEPEPLYSVLEQRGYTYMTSHAADDEWRVTITTE